MDPVNSWAGEPEVTLVSEDGTEVKVHRIFLALYTDQWRQTLQGLQISQLVLLLQDVDGGELEEIVSGIYRPFIVRGDTKDIQDSQADEKENTIEATAEDIGKSHIEGGDLVNATNDDTVDDVEDTEGVICLDDDYDGNELLVTDETEVTSKIEGQSKDEKVIDNQEGSIKNDYIITEDDDSRAISIFSFKKDHQKVRTEESEDESKKSLDVVDDNSQYKSPIEEFSIEKSGTVDYQIGSVESEVDNNVDIKESEPENTVDIKESEPDNTVDIEESGPDNTVDIEESEPDNTVDIKISEPDNTVDIKESGPDNTVDIKESEPGNNVGIIEQVQSKIENYKTDGGTMFACKVCNFKNKRKRPVKDHIESKHLGVKYPCNQCDKVCNTYRTLVEHRNTNHREKKSVTISRCEYCDYTSDTKYSVKKHTNAVHLNLKPYQCELCDKRFHDNGTLQSHIINVHENKTDFCDICMKHVKRIGKHKRENHKERTCQYCVETFTKKSIFLKHLKETHGVFKEKQEKEILRCPSCDYTTRDKIYLRQHDQTKHNITYIYCDQCEYKTKIKSRLQQHQKQKHDNSFEKYKCDVCDYQCIRSDYLKRHKESLHEKVRYPCDQCGYQATRMQYLEKHLQTIHNK